MQYVNLGKTGMKVSRLCLGMMSYGSKEWRAWLLDEQEAKPFIKRALEAGINFFDTADVYSTGESERVTGKLLKELAIRRENVVVATKLDHLDQAIAALQIELSEDEVRQLEEPYQPHPVLGHS